MPSWSFSTVQQINWASFLYTYIILPCEDSNCSSFHVLCFVLQVPPFYWLWWYFINTQASKKKKLHFVCRGHGMFTFLFNNKFLSEWIGEAGFLFWYFIQPCVSVKESFVYHPGKFMAYEFRRPGFRFQLGHTPGYVSPGQSLWQFSLYFFHLWIKDKKSVSFVNPLWNEAALV